MTLTRKQRSKSHGLQQFLLFFAAVSGTLTTVTTQVKAQFTHSWAGNVDPRFWGIRDNWRPLNGAPASIPGFTSSVLFSRSVGTSFPSQQDGLRVFANSGVRDMFLVGSSTSLAFRPEGGFTISRELSLASGTVFDLRDFNGQTNLFANEVNATESRLEIQPRATLRTNFLNAAFRDRITVGGNLISTRSNLQETDFTINAGGQFQQFSGALNFSRGSTIQVDQGGNFTTGASTPVDLANSTINVSGVWNSGSNLQSSSDFTVGDRGSATISGTFTNNGSLNVRGGSVTVGNLVSGTRGLTRLERGTLRVTGAGGLNAGEIDQGGIVLGTTTQLVVDHGLTVEAGQSISLLDTDSLSAGSITLAGGTIEINQRQLRIQDVSGNNQIVGHGTLRGPIVGDTNTQIRATTGDIVLDSLGSQLINVYQGTIDANSNTVAILSTREFNLGNQTEINGGTLLSLSGVQLLSTGTLTTTGHATIDGDFTNNGTVNATDVDGHWLTFLDDVDGAGSFTGNVLFSDTFRPGNSPGSVSFDNLFLDTSSTLEIELGGLTPGTEFDLLTVSGDAFLNGALDVSLFGGFTLDPGQTFDFLTVGGSLSGQFLGLGEGALVGNFGGNDLFISYTGGDGNDVSLFSFSAVPEPGSGIMVLATLFLIPIRQRRIRV